MLTFSWTSKEQIQWDLRPDSTKVTIIYWNLHMTQHRTLLDIVKQLAPELESKCADSDNLGKLPMEVVKILREHGLFTMKLASELGGIDADIVTYMDVIEELSRIDGAIGWNTMIGNSAIGRPGAFLPQSAINTMFKNNEIPLAASVPSPSGKATKTNGGFILSGTWYFSSGINQSTWVSGGFIVENEKPACPRIACMPTSDLTIHDNWHVMGLKGTGSCSYSANNLFVSDEFTFPINDDVPLRGGPMNYLGRPGFVTVDHAAVALGIAKRALETIVEISKSKMRGYNSDLKAVSERGYFKKDLGFAQTKLAAARALVKESHLKAWEYTTQKTVPPPLIQSEMRNSGVYATEVSEEVTQIAFKYGGGGALYLDSKLQKCYRDVAATGQHMMVNMSSYENYANFLLEVDGADAMGVKNN